ncbi:MAG: hypothetical protein HYX79_04555 [Chloroflexi bacterium]|nr:hypothetical protein [Chloroflexota bacterium]
MSNYHPGQTDPLGFTHLKRGGRVELWHNPVSGSWEVYLYPHANRREDWLMHKTIYDEKSANLVFYAVNQITEKDPLVPPPEIMHLMP